MRSIDADTEIPVGGVREPITRHDLAAARSGMPGGLLEPAWLPDGFALVHVNYNRLRARRISPSGVQWAAPLLLTDALPRSSILRTVPARSSVLAMALCALVVTGCYAVPEAPYRPSDAGVVASVSTEGGGVLRYTLTDGRSEAIDPREIRFLNRAADEGDLLLRGETSDGPWAYGVRRDGECWMLLGGGELRDSRLATDQRLSLAFAPGFDPLAHGGPRWVRDRGHVLPQRAGRGHRYPRPLTICSPARGPATQRCRANVT